MHKHTPGPWRVDAHMNVMHRDGMVAFPCISGGFPQEANARLIATAPEMLQMLLQMKEREYNPFEPDNQSMHYVKLARLIDKATGAAS